MIFLVLCLLSCCLGVWLCQCVPIRSFPSPPLPPSFPLLSLHHPLPTLLPPSPSPLLLLFLLLLLLLPLPLPLPLPLLLPIPPPPPSSSSSSSPSFSPSPAPSHSFLLLVFLLLTACASGGRCGVETGHQGGPKNRNPAHRLQKKGGHFPAPKLGPEVLVTHKTGPENDPPFFLSRRSRFPIPPRPRGCGDAEVVQLPARQCGTLPE